MRSLKLNIVILSVLLFIFILSTIIASYYVTTYATRFIASSVISISNDSATRVNSFIYSDHYLQAEKATINPLITSLYQGKKLSGSEIESIYNFLQFNTSIAMFGNLILLFDREGKLLIASDKNYETLYGKDLIDHDGLFNEDSAKEQSYVHKLPLTDDGEEIFAFAKEVVIDGKELGSIMVALDIDAIGKSIDELLKHAPFIIAVITNERGEILYKPDRFDIDGIDLSLFHDADTSTESENEYSYLLASADIATIEIGGVSYSVYREGIDGSNIYSFLFVPNMYFDSLNSQSVRTVALYLGLFLFTMLFFFVAILFIFVSRLRKSYREIQEERDSVSAIINALPDPVVWLDENYIYRGANNLFAKFALQMPSGDVDINQLLGKSDADLYAVAFPDDEEKNARLKRVQDVYTRVLNYGEICRMEEHADVPLPDGSSKRFYLEIVFKPFVIESKNFRGIVGVGRDVTNRKMMEKQLIDARDMANEASKAKSDFLARMSHEIRTPLNGIMGMANIAMSSNKSPEITQYLKIVVSSAENLLNIINDLLDLSKIEAGKMKIERIPFILSSTLGNIRSMMSLNASKNNIILRTHINNDVPEVVVGDPLRTSQVIINLISNAIKFTKDGTIDVEISCKKRESKRAELYFVVRDTGIGMTKEQTEKLFSAFTQADDTVTRKYGGTGLGLVICKSLVEMMEGKIWLESEQDVGTTMHFTVVYGIDENYLTAASLTQKEADNNALSNDEMLLKITKGKRILIADDNAVNLQILELILTPMGFIIDKVTDGDEAFEAVRDNQDYALVFMDVQMPRMNGLEATKAIRQLSAWPKKSTPIVAITANAMTDDVAMCLSAGMDDHVPKPFQLSDIKNAIIKYIR